MVTLARCSTPVALLNWATWIVLGDGLPDTSLRMVFVSLTKLFPDGVPVFRLWTAEEPNC